MAAKKLSCKYARPQFLQDVLQIQSNFSFSKITGENRTNESGEKGYASPKNFLVISKRLLFMGNFTLANLNNHMPLL